MDHLFGKNPFGIEGKDVQCCFESQRDVRMLVTPHLREAINLIGEWFVKEPKANILLERHSDVLREDAVEMVLNSSDARGFEP